MNMPGYQSDGVGHSFLERFRANENLPSDET